MGRTKEQYDLAESHRSLFLGGFQSYIENYFIQNSTVISVRLDSFNRLGNANLAELATQNAPKLVEDLKYLGNCEIIKIIVDIEVNIKTVLQDNPHVDPSDAGSIFEATALYAVQEVFETAQFLTELCYPGSISTLTSYFYCNGISSSLPKKTSLFSLNSPENDKIVWPHLQEFSLSKALKWVNRIGFRTETYANSRISRSLAAFSHLVSLTELRDGEQLFRAMQGLEAFYCDGNGDLRKQLHDKTEVWLGKWSSIYSSEKLYEIRSKFVHGSSLVDYVYSSDLDDLDVKSSAESSNASVLATRILVCTLQRCIVDDITDIEWKVAFETKS